MSLEPSKFADFKNHVFKTLVAESQSFLFQKFYPHCSKKDTYCVCKLIAEPRPRRMKGNSVVGELFSGSWQGNDVHPKNVA